jgi:hypothetical protein
MKCERGRPADKQLDMFSQLITIKGNWIRLVACIQMRGSSWKEMSGRMHATATLSPRHNPGAHCAGESVGSKNRLNSFSVGSKNRLNSFSVVPKTS